MNIFKLSMATVGRIIVSDMGVATSLFSEEILSEIGQRSENGETFVVGKVDKEWCIEGTKRMKRLKSKAFHAKGYEQPFRPYYEVKGHEVKALYQRKYQGMTAEEVFEAYEKEVWESKRPILDCKLFNRFKASRPAKRGRGPHCTLQEKMNYEKKFLKMKTA